MDDKEFDEIMQEYVDSASGSQREDLKKLSDNSHVVKKTLSRFAWATITMSLIVVIGLSIMLPLVLKPDENHQQLIYALTDDEILIQHIDEPEKFLENTNFGLEFPSINYTGILLNSIVLKKNEKIIGLKSEMEIYNEDLCAVSFYAFEKKYRLKRLTAYHELNNEISWNGIKIKFSNNVLYDVTETYMFFEKSSYVYYMKAVTYESKSPCELLDIIF